MINQLCLIRTRIGILIGNLYRYSRTINKMRIHLKQFEIDMWIRIKIKTNVLGILSINLKARSLFVLSATFVNSK